MPMAGQCRSCKAEILRVKSVSGKMIPCDPKQLTLVTADGKTVMGYAAHFSTCPQADAWRVKNKPADGRTGQPADGEKATK